MKKLLFIEEAWEAGLVSTGVAKILTLVVMDKGEQVEVLGSIEIFDLMVIKKALESQTKTIHKKYFLLELWEEFQFKVVRFYKYAERFLNSWYAYREVQSGQSGVKGLTDPDNMVKEDFRKFIKDIEDSKLLQEAHDMCVFLQNDPHAEYILEDRSPIKKKVDPS